MDFELPFLSRMRATHVPELSARDALHHMATASNRGRRPRKVKVTGRIKGPLRSETPDETTFTLDDEGTTLTVKVPRLEAAGLAAGQKVFLEGRILLTATHASLQAVFKGHVVPGGQLRRESAHARQAARLRLTDFLQVHESGLVILGSERAIHDVDDELKKQGCYPGPFRREIVRMTESADVLAAAHRYAGVAQGLLFVRRGGEGHEFRFWSDPAFMEDLLALGLPLYLGLGHPDDRTALDPLVDEAFPTASAAGAALVQGLRAPRATAVVNEQPSLTPETIEPPAAVVKDELYLSNTFIWAVALILGAIVLIVGLR